MNIVFLMLLSISFAVFMVSTSKRCCKRRGQGQLQQQDGSNNNTTANNSGARSRDNDDDDDDDDDTGRNEQGMLIQQERDFWGADVFSTDLDVEEMEWNSNLEMRQIT